MFVGIEIGGTKLQLGVGMANGKLVSQWRGRVNPTAGAAGIRRQIETAYPQLLRTAKLTDDDIRAIGIGFGGPVNDAVRSTIKSHQIAGWEKFPLVEWAERQFGKPVVLGNDADCAGLAEAHWGAGRGCDPIFYITIGSGIGGGLVSNGKVFRGTGLGAAEIGHLRIWDNGESRILEDLASGWAIQRRTGRSVPELAAAVRCGDESAMVALRAAWVPLAEAICSVVALVAPARIVIGGGVSLVGEDVLFAPLRKLVAECVFRPFAESFDIVSAALGEDVVVHGAIQLASQRVAPRN